MKIRLGSRRRRLLVLGALLLISVALIYLFFGNTAVGEKWRLDRARRYQEEISRRLAGDPRYRDVKVEAGIVDGAGVLFVRGTLSSNTDLESLIGIVESTHAPVHINYRVAIQPKK
jgi:hypothetical protein